jgi:tape measure domain-containing protein
MADGSVVIDTKMDTKPTEAGLKSLTKSLVSFAAKMTAVIGVTKLATKAISGMVEAAREIEDITAEFTPLVGGAKNATKMIAALNKEAATTPFELTQIAGVAKQLLPAVGNNVSAITEQFRMLGDTAGGNIEHLQSITRGYTKALLKGKVDMEALNMIADAGVPIYQQLADTLGVSVSQMYTMSSAGEITAKDLTKTFRRMTKAGGIYYKGMQIASETTSGVLSTMRDNITQVSATLGSGFTPVMRAAAKDISDGAIRLKSFLERTKVAQTLAAALTKAYDKLKKSVSNLITQFRKFEKETQLITRLMAGAQKALDNGRRTIDALRGAMEAVAEIPGMKKLVKSLQELGDTLLTVFTDTGFLTDFGTSMAEGIEQAFNNSTLQKVINFAASITAEMTGMVNTVIKEWDKLPLTAALVVLKIEYAFKTLGLQIKTSMTVAFNSVRIAALSLGQTIVTKVVSKIQGLLNTLSKLPGGGLFGDAAKSLDSMMQSFDVGADDLKQQSAQAIADSKTVQKQQQAQYDAELANIYRNYNALTSARDKTKTPTAPSIAPQTGGATGAASTPSGTIDTTGTDAYIDKVQSVTKDLAATYAEIDARLSDGVINTDDAAIKKIDALKSALDDMYKAGVSSKTAGAGGDFVRNLKKQIEDLEASVNPKVAGAKIGTALLTGLKESLKAASTGGIIGSLKDRLSTAWKASQNALKDVISKSGVSKIGKGVSELIDGVGEKVKSGALKLATALGGEKFATATVSALKRSGTTISKYLPVMLKGLSKGWPKKLAKFASSAVKAAGTAVRAVANIVVSGIKTLSTLAALDPSDLLDSLDDFLTNVKTFFTTTLPALPVYAAAALSMITNLLNTLLTNWPTITKAITNAMIETFAMLMNALPSIVTSVITLVSGLVTALIQALPEILSSLTSFVTGGGLALILSAIQSAITSVVAALVDALPDILDTILVFIKTGLPQLLTAMTTVLTTVLNGLVQMLPEILAFVIDAITSIATLLIQQLPTIVKLFAEVLPEVITILLSQLPALITAVLQIITATINAILQSLPAIIDAVAEIIPAIIVQLAIDSPKIIQSIIEMSGQIAAAIIANLPAIVAAVLMIVPRIIYGLAVSLPQFGQAGIDLVYAIAAGMTSAGSAVYNALADIVRNTLSGFQSIYSGAVSIFSGLGATLRSVFVAPINAVIRMINYVISGLNKLSFKLPSWIPGIGGKRFGVDIDKLDYLAKGTDSARGGLTIVGEKGPELVNMPQGAQVFTAKETQNILAGSDMSGITNSLNRVSLPSMSGTGGTTTPIVIKMTSQGMIEVDGKQLASAVWENIDSVAAGA